MLWPSSPLSMHRRLSCCASASIATSPPLLLRQCLFHCASLTPAVGCCIVTSLAAPVPLLLHRHLSRCAAASLEAPHLRRLVVASPTILTCRRLSCRAGWLLPCYLSLCAAVSHFANSLSATVSLSHRPSQPQLKSVSVYSGGLPLSIQRSGMGRKASCGALEDNFRRGRPWW